MPERLVIRPTREVVGEPVRRARTTLEKARGLLGTSPAEQGPLVFEGARQVHTFGMSFPIDVIFCDEVWRVVHVVTDMRPRRMTRWVRKARFTVELPSAARRAGVSRGDELELERY